MTKTSKELTNDWKDKKLYDGLYYIRLKNGKTPIAELETWCRYDDEVEEPYKTSQEFFFTASFQEVDIYDHLCIF